MEDKKRPKNENLLGQRLAMLSNPDIEPLETIRLLEADMDVHTKDLKALDWHELTHKPLELPIPKFQVICECEGRFYKEFYKHNNN